VIQHMSAPYLLIETLITRITPPINPLLHPYYTLNTLLLHFLYSYHMCSGRGGRGASSDPAHVRRMQSFS
jgi:hypothetical protein